MSACMFGPSSSPRLVRLGAEWAGWVFKHAESHQLRAMAGPVSARLMAAVGLVDEGEEGGAEDQGGAEGMQVGNRHCSDLQISQLGSWLHQMFPVKSAYVSLYAPRMTSTSTLLMWLAHAA